ncbi:3-methyl-2-oxobutanoate hydroxymethyltransferase [Pseudomonas sp. SDI]|uniref:3-methyl-2-oxobutanoate hydroxymethyltransferase n=1 Tax=Pseudomonas sp. SDI TaxID=2170734 RepID=UPI000DE73EE9|nr:3-methyl-2-oxobutanoate hydroxymethyltransferase [Pseudomonas sp. SDI]PWB31319.1 3-methyl-2-oxobutanoate hydroxymethyltransferase [Pseudomonas sp. SDI]
MSTHARETRLSIPAIQQRKGAGSLVALTAYSLPMARWVDRHADVIIVGDSVGMVLYGMPSTLGVSLEMMIAHGQAVMRGSQRACVVVDLPFGSYQASPEQAFHSAARMIRETGAQGVKLEGGTEMAETVAFLVQRGIPVMAHVGLMPQQVNSQGGFRAQGRDAASAAKVRDDALAMQAAGAFAVVLEGIAEALARQLSEQLQIPTIGIGASPACDGQVLVSEDLLGLFGEYQPRFVKRYADLQPQIEAALECYAAEVRAGSFPSLEHCFGVGR